MLCGLYSTTSENCFEKNCVLFWPLCSLHDSVCVCISALVQFCSSSSSDIPLSVPHHCRVQLLLHWICRVLHGSVPCCVSLEEAATIHRKTAPVSLCNYNRSRDSQHHFGAFHLSMYQGASARTLWFCLLRRSFPPFFFLHR